MQAAARAGATVRWAEVDISTGELPVEQYGTLLSERTRLVAVTAASNILGTRPDVAAITAPRPRRGALTYVDGVHATPHTPVDAAPSGPTSTRPAPTNGPARTSAWSSPTRTLLETLRPDKLASSPDTMPGTVRARDPRLRGPGRGDGGGGPSGQPGRGPPGTRRERILASMTAVHDYERTAIRHMLGGLNALEPRDHVRQGGAPDGDRVLQRGGPAPAEVAAYLAATGLTSGTGTTTPGS